MPASRHTVLPGLSAATYVRHPLHGKDRIWVEKNCYADLFIELVHALGLEPAAMLPFTLAVDFEGDQWTFFKPSHTEMRELYGIDVQEMTAWRPLIEHAVEHLSAGRLISTEADAWWMPDTAGTDYRTKHTKTTIVLADLDLEAQRLGYFHNAGYYELEGEDFRRIFRLDEPADEAYLPLFAELVRVDRVQRRDTAELVEMSKALVHRYLAWRPATNPVRRFAERFVVDLPSMQERGLAHYHAWAFGTVRQLGAAFELAAENLKWLSANGGGDFSAAAAPFERIAQANKALILKVARAVNAKRALDAAALFDEMAADWEAGMAATQAALG